MRHYHKESPEIQATTVQGQLATAAASSAVGQEETAFGGDSTNISATKSQPAT